MKKIISLLLVIALVLAAAAALADGTVLDGSEERNIQINPTGENDVPEGVSPTTGRNLAEVKEEAPEGAVGLAVTGRYLPIIVQIVNTNGGLNSRAPLNGTNADVVYQTLLTKTGGDRMTMVFSDVIPEYVGYTRSTRLTQVRIRQEWDCPYVTSGYSVDVPAELDRLGTDKSIMFQGDSLGGHKVTGRIKGAKAPGAPDNEVFHLTELIDSYIPADYLPKTHAFRFTDEMPEGGDEATFVYVNLGEPDYNSRLEYDEDTNTYVRYLTRDNLPVEYSEAVPENLRIVRNDTGDGYDYAVDALNPGDAFEFSNVIVQFVDYNWISDIRPDPILTGTGNADYFMGGRHMTGVWAREDYDSRTVFYGEDGSEIELQRGKTLIIFCDTNRSENQQISYE